MSSSVRVARREFVRTALVLAAGSLAPRAFAQNTASLTERIEFRRLLAANRFNETDMLVRTMEQGRDLAATLGRNTCALMRGHGAVVATASLKEAVIAAIYLKIDAEVQLQAMAIGTPRRLSDAEVERSRETQFSPLALDRAWEYFCARAGVPPI